jgi:pimeloyl-ACP methyl ester carboxylesterase
METILIAGFWLDGDSWGSIADDLRAAGHTVHAPTLPGMESKVADRSSITLRDHVDAVIDLVDSVEGPVALVGHSGGGAIAWAVADARPDRIDRLVYVDSGPLGDGGCINDELPIVDGEIPLPDWSAFEGELADFTDEIKEEFIVRAIPQPAHVATDKQVLENDARYDIPSVVITTTFPAETMRKMMAEGHRYFAELAKVRANVDIVDLPTSHWPQFTKPPELSKQLVKALS